MDTKPAGDVSGRRRKGIDAGEPTPSIGEMFDRGWDQGHAAGMAAAVEMLGPWIQHEERCFYRNGLQVRCTCGLTAALEEMKP